MQQPSDTNTPGLSQDTLPVLFITAEKNFINSQIYTTMKEHAHEK